MRFIFLLIVSVWLVGCEEKVDYPYLMQHPLALKQEVNRCNHFQDNRPSEQEKQYAHCQMIEKAALNFNALLMKQQEDPQAFGQLIMQAQSECLSAKEKSKSCEDAKVYLGVLSLSRPE